MTIRYGTSALTRFAERTKPISPGVRCYSSGVSKEECYYLIHFFFRIRHISKMAKPVVIDAHHHLWHYSAAEYGWIDDRMAALQRDFLPADLTDELAKAGVD